MVFQFFIRHIAANEPVHFGQTGVEAHLLGLMRVFGLPGPDGQMTGSSSISGMPLFSNSMSRSLKAKRPFKAVVDLLHQPVWHVSQCMENVLAMNGKKVGANNGGVGAQARLSTFQR
jgi:hypothetical protein